MVFGGERKIVLTLHKWFAWYPVRLNKFSRELQRQPSGYIQYENLRDFTKIVWLQYVYRKRYLSDVIDKYTYQLLPDCTHPDFIMPANDILKKML